MIPPDCPKCHEPMQWRVETVFSCPNMHYSSLTSIARMNLEAAFDADPDLYNMFFRGITQAGWDENSPEYNIDLIAHGIGSTVHQIHLLLASDIAVAEFAENHMIGVP